jgi:hypothetical protein
VQDAYLQLREQAEGFQQETQKAQVSMAARHRHTYPVALLPLSSSNLFPSMLCCMNRSC